MTDFFIIAAVAENGIIGYKNDLPWKDRPYAREDMRHFAEATKGHAVIMGRKTFDSILEKSKKPLPGRLSIVITRNPSAVLKADSVIVTRDLDEAIDEAETYSLKNKNHYAWIAGGAQIYEQAMPLASRLMITEIHETFPGDAVFPPIDNAFVEIERQDRGLISFVEYARRDTLDDPDL